MFTNPYEKVTVTLNNGSVSGNFVSYRSTEVIKSKCPSCGHILDAATPIDNLGEPPQPGDLSVCISCTNFLRYTLDMLLEILPEDDLLQLPTDVCLDLYDARRKLLLLSTKSNPISYKE